eukprot:scaffold2459_cov196-Pinguiococcus_pyrenoidosus.AAC.1
MVSAWSTMPLSPLLSLSMLKIQPLNMLPGVPPLSSSDCISGSFPAGFGWNSLRTTPVKSGTSGVGKGVTGAGVGASVAAGVGEAVTPSPGVGIAVGAPVGAGVRPTSPVAGPGLTEPKVAAVGSLSNSVALMLPPPALTKTSPLTMAYHGPRLDSRNTRDGSSPAKGVKNTSQGRQVIQHTVIVSVEVGDVNGSGEASGKDTQPAVAVIGLDAQEPAAEGFASDPADLHRLCRWVVASGVRLDLADQHGNTEGRVRRTEGRDQGIRSLEVQRIQLRAGLVKDGDAIDHIVPRVGGRVPE